MAGRDLTAMGYRRIVILLVVLVVVPTFMMLALGVVLLFLGEAELNLLMGLLVLALSGAAATGVILVWVFVRREANLSQLQSDFVSKVSHELRTPLTSIRMFTETLALRRGDPEAEEQCIRALERESSRLQELIDRLLDWGRMESGRREFPLRDTSVEEVVRSAVEAFEPLIEDGSLKVDVPSSLPHVRADRAAISDALFNLLTNALKYGGEPPSIELLAREDAHHVRIHVTDRGPGIPQSEHKRIFQKFYRMDDLLARAREGSGLGLAIVKHVMKAHKGKVEVESSPGNGSTFTLVLPVAKQSRESEPGASDPGPTGETAAES